MSNPIPQAAVEAAAEGIYERAFRQELPEAPIDLARAALEAAMPEIRAQIVSEIRAPRADDEVWAESVKAYHAAGYTQPPDDYDRMFWDAGMAYAARIAEKGLEQ